MAGMYTAMLVSQTAKAGTRSVTVLIFELLLVAAPSAPAPAAAASNDEDDEDEEEEEDEEDGTLAAAPTAGALGSLPPSPSRPLIASKPTAEAEA